MAMKGLDEFLKKYVLATNLKEVAKDGFKAGYKACIENDKQMDKMQKRIDHLEAREKDLERCLSESNFWL